MVPGKGSGSRAGARHAVLNDLSPTAGFIAANYTLPFDVAAFADAGRALLDEVEAELGWMYDTLHADGKTKGRIDYTVWSEGTAMGIDVWPRVGQREMSLAGTSPRTPPVPRMKAAFRSPTGPAGR